jgi:hypothetical protein
MYTVQCPRQANSSLIFSNVLFLGSSFYQKGFRLVLKIILGQITNAVDHNATQIYPVHFDHSSRDDVPQFLRDKQSFSLPSEIHPLLLSLAGLNARPIGGTEELRFNDTELQRKINQWENTIRTIQRKHNHHRSGSLVSITAQMITFLLK